MALRAIAYSSQAKPGLLPSNVRLLTREAKLFNQIAGVTGVLLFDGSWFFQYIEGPEQGLRAVYERVRGSRSHTLLTEMASGDIEARVFPCWAMREIPIDSASLGCLLMAEWLDFTQQGLQKEGAGISQLKAVVQTHLDAA